VTDGEGGGSDPVTDSGWVREELHLWIYNNVAAKWRPICRKPAKLYDMFTGYHARSDVVGAALVRVGGAT
jgi:ribosome-binding ATPase YchF (GTP1/OBG family)